MGRGREGKGRRDGGGRGKESTVIVGRVTMIEMRRSGLVLTADIRNNNVLSSHAMSTRTGIKTVLCQLASSSFFITRKHIKTANTNDTCSLLFGPSHLQVQDHLATA